MAIKLTSTKDAATLQGVKILVHGPAGAGKTVLCATAPSPLIISAEAGLLSLADSDIPVLEVNTLAQVREAYSFINHSEEAKKFETICIDSLTEVAEEVLTSAKKAAKDPRQAYGVLIDEMGALVRAFRDLPGRHVYMSAQQERVQNDIGGLLYSTSMPGKQLANNLPYMFDEVFALRVEKDAENNIVRWLQTVRDVQYDAKDRSGKLEQFEEPDLGCIINKIISKGK